MESVSLADGDRAAVGAEKTRLLPVIDLSILQAAMEATNEAILITSAELDEPGPRIEYANPAFTRLTGYEPDEVVGRSPRRLQGPKTDRKVLDRIRVALVAGAKPSTTGRTARPTSSNGSSRPSEGRMDASRIGSRPSATSPSDMPPRTARP